MSVADFLDELRELDVELWVRDGKLKYRGPRKVLSTDLLARLKRDKEELLDLLERRADRSNRFPLSLGQRGLWVVYRNTPESFAYNVAMAARFRELDTEALRRALEALADRHPSLRTRFSWQGHEVVQEVHESTEVDFRETAASGWSDEELDERVLEAIRRPFDLQRGPVLRARLWRRGTRRHIFLLVTHHILCDGWSWWILRDELRRLYLAEKAGDSATLPPVAFSYRDFVDARAAMSAGRVGEDLWQFWKNELAGAVPALELPTDRPRPPIQTYEGRCHAFEISTIATSRLTEVARREGTTLYVTLLTAFEALLHRYTGQVEILVGSPTAGRDDARFDRVVGYFVNPVVVRLDLSGNPTAEELLRRVHRAASAATAHRDYPFPLLVERLRPPADPSRSALFQVMFNVFESQRSEEGFEISAVTREDGHEEAAREDPEFFAPPPQGSQFDISLMIGAARSPLRASFLYNTDLLDPTTVRRMAVHLENLLADVVTRPRRRISELALLASSERHQVVAEWNDTAVEARDVRVHELFEEQVERTPERVALGWEGRELSYRELDRRAEPLARLLRRLGVGPEVLVGVLLERSAELVISLLGVLEAGGVFVPLDPGDPASRLAFKLEDSQVRIVLTEQRLLERLPATAARVLLVEETSRASSGTTSSGTTTPAVRVEPDHPAYMIYTSGSSGRPKGAVNTHRAIVSRLRWMQETYRLDARDRVLQKTPASFDVSVWELLWPLLCGAQMVLARPDGHRDSGYLARLVVDEGITTIHFVPSMLRVFLEDERVRYCRSLRRVVASGEALPADLVRRFAERLPGVELHNLYGPTEAAIDVTFHPCDLEGEGLRVPIGRPVADTRIHLLDEYLRPVAVGVTGELCIDGVQLARGYASRPSLTAERFVPDPVSACPGRRIYRTGDLARRLADGEVEYLGRTDHQVKLRGRRIELGEIEAVLGRHPAVREAVVLVYEPRPGEPELVGYLVWHGSTRDEQEQELRGWLRGKLPEPMIPAVWQSLEELPLTPAGKVDRAALPGPPGPLPRRTPSVPPRTPDEEILAGIWSRVLGRDDVGSYDDFFDLGGHSLLATRVFSRVEQIFHVDLPVRMLFENPTLRELAAAIAAAGREPGPGLPRIAPSSEEVTLPLSFAQQRLWFLDQLQPLSPAYHMPTAYRLEGELATGALSAALREIVRRHATLRTRFPSRGGRPRQVISEEFVLPVPVVDLSALSPGRRRAAVRRLLAEHAVRPFDLARGPLLRARLVRLGERDHVLGVNVSHIVTDGWSQGIFYRELTCLYEAFRTKTRHGLPELPVRYADFALWQRRHLTRESLAGHFAYWRRQLAEMSVLRLPVDRPRPALQTHRGVLRPLRLPADLHAAVRACALGHGTTLYMTSLAVFLALLGRVTGQRDVVVGSPIANRNREEVEGLIGFFVNSLVMRGDLSGNPTFGALLERVRETALDAYAHQDLPFEQLVEELRPTRDLSRHPLFQVSFAVQNAPREETRLTGLVLRQVIPDSLATRFDLELYLWEAEEGLEGVTVCNTDLFDATTVERLCRRYETLLRDAADRPERHLDELSLLPASERHQLCREWQGAAPPRVPAHVGLHRAFERQAGRTPDAVAVSRTGGALSFGGLDAAANRLARHLRRLAVAPETPETVAPETVVALYLERSPELVVAVLAVLKAGAAYLPLEPGLPKRRLATLLEDGRAGAVLTRDGLADDLPAVDAPIVRLDADAAAIAARSPTRPAAPAHPDNLAYVLYTSGSTGRPKGVAVSHRAASSYLDWAIRAYRVREARDGAPLHSSLGFDLTVTSLFAPLLAGRRVVLLPEEEHLESLAKLLGDARGFALVKLTPTHLEFLRRRLEGTRLNGPSVLILGGEALAAESLAAWRRESPSTRLVNEYGPTEAVVGCTSHEVTPRDPATGPVPVGRPIDGARIHLADARLRPVPTGTAGEILAGGPGLARGYLGRPRQTAASFVPDPFGDTPGGRLYRTGDLARHRRDGVLAFHGRIDDQLEVRGFRIEPGEIEATLAEHPDVRDVVVLAARSDRLAACVVPRWPRPGESRRDRTASLGQVGRWQTLYDSLYGERTDVAEDDDGDATFDTIGWNSSYTGEPLPAEEMREWLDATIERIEALRPRRVLEIGCGTGMILHRVAPRVESYLATDFSRPAIERLRARLASPGYELPQVRLLERAGHELGDLPEGGFDTVVLNSVVQYFPDVDYLGEVLRSAARATSPGGSIFVGDVRSLALHAAFCASVELHESAPSTPVELFRERVRSRQLREQELLLDPGFFVALRRELPRIGQVRIRPKLGRADNELVRFRYDAVLHLDVPASRPAASTRLDWRHDGLSLDALSRTLREHAPRPLVVTRVPNRRLARENRLTEILDDAGSAHALHEVAELRSAGEEHGVALEELVTLGREAGYGVVEPSWLAGRSDGSWDVILGDEGTSPAPSPPSAGERAGVRGHANQPLRQRAVRELLPRWKAFLEERLPEPMVPSSFVVVDELPLLPSGKVDREALGRRVAEDERIEPEETWAAPRTAPRTAAEEALAAIWSEVLGVRRVGVHDDFFHLGGHSLLATQVVSRIRQVLGIELPLRTLFEKTTLSTLAGEITAATPAPDGAAIERAPRGGELPLSFAQQRLWFLHQLAPESAAYNMPAAFHLDGTLEVAALEASLREIVRRHEVLRTLLPSFHGRPRQRISTGVSASLPVVDLGAVARRERLAVVRRLVAAEAGRPFDLTVAPLLRTLLCRLDAERFVLFVNFHHVASDGWSQGIFARELACLYEAFVGRRPSPLPEPEIQYADFAVWQRERLTGARIEKALDYWRGRLAGAASLTLPSDRPRPAVQTHRGAARSFELDGETADLLRRSSLDAGASLFMVTLAAFMSVLHRYTAQPDVVVGSPIANRDRREIEGLIGFFVNTLALRGRLGEGLSFRDLLGQLRETTLGAYAYQDLPFEKLVEELRPERDLTRNPFFQVLFAFQNAPRSEPELSGLLVTPMELGFHQARFDLEMHLWEEADDRLHGRAVYNTDLFDPTTIDRFLRHFATHLAGVAAAPATSLVKIPLLRPAERHQLVHELNDRRTSYAEGLLHRRFEAQVGKSPDAAAVVLGDRALTYRELDRRADQLARDLRRRGVGHDQQVGLMAERSLEMAVGVLGILKAGAAYVPLDPGYPRERLRFMIEETGGLVLRTPGVREQDAASVGPCEWPESARESTARLDGGTVDPLGLAYVVYTSGSTGRPKGVALSHQALLNLVDWHLDPSPRGTGLLGGRRTLQFASLSFDASFHEMFATWCSGGCLVLVPEALRRDMAALARFLSEAAIEKAILPVVVLQRIAEECLAQGLEPAPREVTATGEQLYLPPSVVELFARYPGIALHNHYGPSETHVVTACRLPPDPHSWPTHPSIGRPIARTAIHLLDRRLELVAFGVAGELFIGGAALARGYLERPASTAEKFVPDRFAGPGGRLCKTGDLARYRSDGTIEFLGRIDHQVKVRGFRVEPGEIEALLGRHPAVREVSVLARQSRPGGTSADRRLVAYLVPVRPDGKVTTSELRDFSLAELPEHMVPAVFVWLEALPLSPTGKVDRRALPVPDEVRRSGPEAVRAAPRAGVEEILAETWTDLMGLERVGRHDNFFELGGHSLLATQVVSRLRRILRVELPLHRLFDHPVLADLAASPELRNRTRLRAPPIVPVPRDRRPPLSFAQQRLWFLAQLEPESPAYNVAAAFRLEGRLDVAALVEALREIVRRHETLRTTFPSADGEPWQEISPRTDLPLPFVDLGRLDERRGLSTARRLVSAEARAPFDLARGPVFRALLLRLDTRSHLLVLDLHHIVSDGWSQGMVFYRELAVLYQALRGGRRARLAPLPIRYADFAAWQREWLTGEALEQQLAYWRDRLEGMATLELPTDRPRSTAASYRGALRPFHLDEETTTALRRLGLRGATSLYMTLAAATLTWLRRITGQTDVTVGSPIAGRNHEELEGLIGFFVNTLVLRGDLANDPPFRELLGRVRKLVLEAFAHQDVPFERLVDELRPQRDLSRHPLFQVFFALQNVPDFPPSLEKLEVEQLELETRASHFDLEIYFWEAKEIRGMLFYDTTLFDATTLLRWSEHLQRLLVAVAANGEPRLGELALWSAAQRHQVSVECNVGGWPSTTALGRGLVWTELFESRCREAPDRPAVIAPGGVSLTYGELDRRAGHLARRLLARGVGPEVRVGLLHERSPDAVVAMTAVLKAGGAYVPLDSSYPRERLEFMIRDAEVALLVTSEASLVKAALEDAGLEIVLTGTEPSAGRTEDLPRPALARSAAYVIYTSGSTGRPKGVVVEHRSLAWYVRAAAGHYALAARDRVLQAASISFDISVGEIFPALACGAAVVLTPAETIGTAELFQLCRRDGVSVLFPATALWHELASALAEDPAAVPPSLRLVSFGGEQVLPERIADWYRATGGKIRLLNGYGPTEGTVESAVCELSPGSREAEVPIGRPVARTRVHVLDRSLRPVLPGTIGELCVAGAGLARGYLRRPRQTAERFVPDPAALRPGERLYRTGDLARWRRDARLVLAGRLDQQVKVHGFRVEPGEVEAVLAGHPAVREAAVVVGAAMRLAAYVVANDPRATPDAFELRDDLRRRLPRYMVPVSLSFLAALPRTPNDKVDRAALSRLEVTGAGGVSHIVPRRPLEKALARIWAEVLGLERVSLHDNFFELGGDSILTIRIVARAHREGLTLTPKNLFEHQTVAELAHVTGTAPRPRAEQGPVTGPVPLTPIQRWFFEQEPPEPWHYNWAALFATPRPLDFREVDQAAAWLTRRHDALRLRWKRRPEGWSQVNADLEDGAPSTRVDLSRLGEAELTRVVERAAAAAHTSLDLEAGPLFRFVFFTTGAPPTDRLLLVIHHLVVDAVSWPLLLEDFTAACRQIRAGRAVALPDKTTSFKLWAERLSAHAHTEQTRREIPFWLAQRGAGRLPVDFERGDDTAATSATVTVSLAPDRTEQLLRRVPAVYRTRIDDVLLTALARAFQAWTGAGSLLVDFEGHGREEIFPDVDLSRTVGWLTSVHPVLLSLEGAEDEETALKAIKEQLRAVPRRGIGFGLLRYLGPAELAAELRRSPRAEVSFNFLGQRQGPDSSAALVPVGAAIGASQSPRAARGHLLEVDSVVEDGRLSMSWTFSRGRYRRETVAGLARRVLAELEALVTHCLSPRAGGATPSDFPLAGLGQAELDTLVGRARDVEDLYPLAPMQEGMLFHALHDPDSPSYLGQLSWTLSGALEVEALRGAWLRLVERHGVLRTRFAWEGLERPLQVVERRVELPWEEDDWRGIPAARQKARFDELCREDRERGFDPRRAPLIRLRLLRLGDETWRMLWSEHHLLSDGWSLPVLLDELFTFYRTPRQAAPSDLPPPRPYREYIAWLAEQDLDAAETFWRRTLAGFRTPVFFTGQPTGETGREHARRSRRLPAAATAVLEAFARRRQLTLSTLTQGAWALLLARYSRRDDVVFGTTVSGRPPSLRGAESMVGLFINTLPLRVRLPAGETVLAWLRRLQADHLEARQFEHSPLASVQGWSEVPPPRRLFDNVLVFENYPVETAAERPADLVLDDFLSFEQTSYPLSISAVPGRELLLDVGYDPMLLEAGAVERMLRHLGVLFDAMTSGPERRLAEISLLDPAARHQLLTEWNDTGPQNELAQPYTAPRSPIETELAGIWAHVLGVERVGIRDDFFELGGDSILTIRIAARAHSRGWSLSPRDVFQHPTVAELALVVDTVPRVHAEQGLVTGPVPLTPIQRWFFEERGLTEPWHYNWAALLRTREPVGAGLLEKALAHLLRHHDALRLRFARRGPEWTQTSSGFEDDVPFSRLDLSRLAPADLPPAETAAAAAVQASLNLEAGPLLRLVRFETGAALTDRLLLVVHHLVVDQVSWPFLLEDLDTACRQLAAGRAVSLPAKTSSFKVWAERLAAHARGGEARREAPFWLELLHRAGAAGRIATDFEAGRDTVAASATISVSLGTERTRQLLRQVPAAYRTRIDDVLLAALALGFARQTGESSFLVDLEGHGREEIVPGVDLSRTVGWLTSLYPVLLDLRGVEGRGAALKAVKEQLRAVPRRGVGFGLLRYLGTEEEARELRRLPRAEVSFNYLSQTSLPDPDGPTPSLLEVVDEAVGESESRRARRSHLLDLNGAVEDGRLRVSWTYSRDLHRRASVERLADSFVEELEGLIDHCLSVRDTGLEPSDFPLAGLDRARLDSLPRRGGQIEDVYPLSPMQEGMLFHSLYAPGSPVYFEQSSWALEDGLAAAALRTAFEQLAARHAVLRTAFAWQDLERPVQIVYRGVELPWEELDWTCDPSGEDQERRLEVLSEADRRRGFELDQAPLMRLILVRLAGGGYRLVWSLHHLLLDGWSTPLVLDELSSLYEAARRGAAVELPPPRPYRDFIAWIERQDLQAAEVFWRRQLEGFTAPTSLPARSAKRSPHGGSEHRWRELTLDAVKTSALERFARRHRLTLATLVQGAWGLVLSRYSGEQDVVFGCTASCRPASLEEVESIVGLLINTLPVRLHVRPEAEVVPWLYELRQQQARSRQFDYSPLVRVQAWSEVAPPMPLFESLLVVESYPLQSVSTPGRESLALEDPRAFEQTSYPLSILAVPGHELSLHVGYDPSRFAGATAGRMLRHLAVLLAGLAGDPGRSLASLPLLSRAERHQLLVEWNDTAAARTPERTVVQVFEQQATATPDVVAIVYGERRSTYQELDARANQLARYLRARSVDRDVLVGLCVERSVEMVVGVLGIWKAGAAYVPLDPIYPRARRAFMVEETRGPVLLTQSSLREELRESLAGSAIRLICLDDEAAAIGRESAGKPEKSPVPVDLAYVTYTSGSTGRPKGVALSHRALSNLVDWHLDPRPGGGRLLGAARTLQFASLSFDVSFHELFTALCSGGSAYVVPKALRLDTTALIRYLVRERIEKAVLPVVMLQRLAEECLEQGDLALDLAEITTTGEQLHVTPAIVRFFQRFTAPSFHNHYGPSETHVVTALTLAPTPSAWPSHPSIGRPIAATAIYLLDPRLELVGFAIAGELFIGGVSLARGYLDRPRLTAEKFVPDPFARKSAGGRLYSTGDLARYLDDGTIEFLGRGDHQVKVRGFRVEPEEIEAVLARHPAVREAVVLARQASPGRGPSSDTQLVAYLVSDPDNDGGRDFSREPSRAELRDFLSASLPEHMVPSVFVRLKALPLSPTGKIDRRALPAPEPQRNDPGGTRFAEPKSAAEKALARIWEEILGFERVGARDDFFALGGHSLLAVRLMSRIERRFGVRLPLATLFDESTVEGLARALRDRRTPARASSRLVAIQPSGSVPPFFCVHPGGGHVLCYRDLARYLGPDQPFYGLQARGIQGGESFLTEIPDMAGEYLAVVEELEPRGPYRLGGWSMGALVAFEMARQLGSGGRSVALLALIDPPVACPQPSSDDETSPRGLIFFAQDMGLEGDRGTWDELAKRSPEEGLEHLLIRAQQAALLPGDVDLPRLRHLYRLFETNTQAMATYTPQPYDGKITLFTARESAGAAAEDPTYGWGELAAGGVEVCVVPGDHFTMVREPHVERLAAELGRHLRKSRRGVYERGPQAYPSAASLSQST